MCAVLLLEVTLLVAVAAYISGDICTSIEFTRAHIQALPRVFTDKDGQVAKNEQDSPPNSGPIAVKLRLSENDKGIYESCAWILRGKAWLAAGNAKGGYRMEGEGGDKYK